MRSWALWLAPGLMVLAIVAGVLWWKRRPPPEIPDPPVVPEDGDTGFSRTRTEAFMREIGYVQ